MYKLVDDCSVTIHGRSMHKKVLYLPFEYATRFDERSMKRCLEELDIGEPKFVIMLAPSIGLHALMKKVHGEALGTARAEFIDPSFGPSEIDLHDDFLVQQKVAVFMKACVIPIAIKTHALILISGSNDCCLSKALSDVAFSEQQRLGSDCPFTVLATVDILEIYNSAKSYEKSLEGDGKISSSIAGQVLKCSNMWNSRKTMIEAQLEKPENKQHIQNCDLNHIASRFIVFEGYNAEYNAFQSFSRNTFESLLLQVLTRSLPIIAIQSHHIETGLYYLSDLVSRGIPVLLLDTNERTIVMDSIPPKGPTTRAAIETCGFPSIPAKALKQMEFDDDGSLGLDGRKLILTIAQNMVEEKWRAYIERGFTDSYDCSMFALLHSAVRLGSRPLPLVSSFNMSNDASLEEEIEKAVLMKENNEQSKSVRGVVPMELANMAASFVLLKVEALKTLAALSRVVKWLIMHCNKRVQKIDKHILKVNDKGISLLIQALLYYIALREKLSDILVNDGKYFSSTFQPSKVSSILDVFTNPNYYSRSLHDIEDIRRMIVNISDMQKLPEANSLEALIELCDAWDQNMKYHVIADSYKFVAKTSYKIVLLLGILVTVLSVLNSQGYNFKNEIVLLGFITTAVLGYVSFMNPSVRWQQLRVAALTLESQIYLFRCRAGQYRIYDSSKEDAVDRAFRDTVCQIKQVVLDGADVQNTDFYYHRVEHLPSDKPKKPAPVKTSEVLHELKFSKNVVPREVDVEQGYQQRDAIDLETREKASSENTPLVSDRGDGYKTLPDDEHWTTEEPRSPSAFQHWIFGQGEAKAEFATLDESKDLVESKRKKLKSKLANLKEMQTKENMEKVVKSINAAKALISNYPFPEQLDPERYLKTNMTIDDMITYASSIHDMLLEHVFHQIKSGDNEEDIIARSDDEETHEHGDEVCAHVERFVLFQGKGKKFKMYSKYETDISDTGELSIADNPKDDDELTVSSIPAISSTAKLFSLTKNKHPADSENETKKNVDNKDELSDNISLYHLLIDHEPNLDKKNEMEPLIDNVAVPVEAVTKCLRPPVYNGVDDNDSGHEILTPDLYIEFRLKKHIEFYRNRLPTYYFMRRGSQFMQIIGSIVTSSFAMWDLVPWTAAASVIIAAVAAHAEFHDTDSKIKRYSTAIHSLENLVNWWDTLLSIDKSSVENIDRLIMTGESIISNDYSSWGATSQAIKSLQNAKSENKASEGGSSESSSESSSSSSSNSNSSSSSTAEAAKPAAKPTGGKPPTPKNDGGGSKK
jgi:hypothetical protein